MQIKAIRQIIDYDADNRQTVVFNIGDTGDLSDKMLAKHEGAWEPVDALPQLDHDGDGHPGGSVTAQGDDLPALRARYKELAGKNPFNGWDAEELMKRIAELDHDGDGESDQSDEAPVS